MKKAETQEQEFLEVCSSYDHDLLTGKKEMTLKDYERITYLGQYRTEKGAKYRRV